MKSVHDCSRDELRALITHGHPVDPTALEGWAWRGTSLGLPRFVERLTWKTFQKTFHRDPASGRLLGWNVRVHQDGVGAPSRPLLRDGKPVTTWHYEVRSPLGLRTPPGFDRGLIIDYGLGNNPALDTIRFSKDPLVALEPGNMDRLLGVTWLSLGPLQVETPTYFLLEREAPLSYVPPDAVAASRGPMFAFERRWAELLFIATLGGDAPTSFVGLWEKLGRDAPPYFAPGLRAAVYALTFAPVLMPEFRRPFFALDAGAQRACVARLARRGLVMSQLLSTVKLLACFAGETTRLPSPRPSPQGEREKGSADVVVVGSGPAGAAVARECALRGLEVVVLEEGHTARDFPESGLEAMSSMYRDLGTSVAFGPTIIPFLQGRAVGGTSVINGGICWRLPRDVHAQWAAADPLLGEALPFEELARAEAHVEALLGVQPTSPDVAGAKNLLLAKGAATLGLEHRPIRRNVRGCVGSGRCLQGCPHGAKLSVDRTFLADAVTHGARVLEGVRVERVLVEGGRALGVTGVTATGDRVTVTARRAVVMAASAIQTPLLLRASGLTRRPVGDGLMAHPGVSVTGLFDQEVNNHLGATQGHEVIGLRHEGLKFEALGFDLSILAGRVPGVGDAFAARRAQLSRYAVWGAALKASAQGTVRGVGRHAFVRYALTGDDVKKARRATRVLVDLFLAAGAKEAYPGVPGMPEVVTTHAQAAALEENGPLDARAYSMSMTHLFATARMGSERETSVVGTDFQHHDVRGLYVADSSVFPSNTGVNPQVTIMALAHLCAERLAKPLPAPQPTSPRFAGRGASLGKRTVKHAPPSGERA